jgi:hypothetical protein
MSEEKSITLLIEGHGLEYLRHTFRAEMVELLTFSGLPGELGISNFCPDGKPIDFAVLEKLSEIYDDVRSEEQQKDTFEDGGMHHEIRSLYARAGIHFKDAAFQVTRPVNERFFDFEEQEHDNCIKCTENPEILATRCKRPRDVMAQYMPAFGLFVVTSSVPEDLPYTLAAYPPSVENPLSDKLQFEQWKRANMHDSRPTALYWRSKIPDSSESATDFESMISERGIRLSQLVNIFRAMGYGHIRIFDPSCRAIAEVLAGRHVSNLAFKKAATAVMERLPEKPSTGFPDLRATTTKRAGKRSKRRQKNKRRNTKLGGKTFHASKKRVTKRSRVFKK